LLDNCCEDGMDISLSGVNVLVGGVK